MLNGRTDHINNILDNSYKIAGYKKELMKKSNSPLTSE